MTLLLEDHYAELVSLTQLYLLREESLKKARVTDPATWAFFQKFKGPSLVQKTSSFVNIGQPANRLPPLRATINPPPSPDPQPQPSPDPTPLSPPQNPPSPSPDPVPSTPPEKPSPDPGIPQTLTQTKSTSQASRLLTLEPLAAPPSIDWQPFWQLFRTLFANHPLCATIPPDTIAQKNSLAWMRDRVIPPVILLSFDEEEKHLTFLKNVAQAISLRLAPARVISAAKLEKEKRWDQLFATPGLRLVIASDYGLYLQRGLMMHYREVPQQGKHYLQNIPLLLLSDPSLYLKQPQLKALLWRAICNEFASSTSAVSSR